eukprot:CAMPEP_0116555500 /NCGR_PEP_ID=MMETSP0397-20121206/8181_1 /TAXON_ID=216820 /ORGANISM="Cyclophora tenuis, Strain ECT3854" /LENGTH=64 /DNA_ID=CAMNT_0004080777 /DNA_START=482 /DNA_END=676 /DNA_ORIENTATION=+
MNNQKKQEQLSHSSLVGYVLLFLNILRFRHNNLFLDDVVEDSDSTSPTSSMFVGLEIDDEVDEE